MGSGGQNKLTWEQTLVDFEKRHGDTYGYEDSVYISNTTPIQIFCKKCQIHFSQIPKNHKKGGQCPDCIKKRYSKLHSKGKDKFIEDAINTYGDLDNYSKVEYVNNKTEITLICKEHGEYQARPDLYLNGSRCKSCRRKISKRGNSKYSNKELFKEAGIDIFGDVTDYSKVGEINKNSKVELRCKKHDHTYTISVTCHLGGQKCPKCAMENYAILRRKTKEQFVKEATEVYNDLHDYTNTVYEGCNKELEIRCKKHNHVFKTLPGNYINGFGCNKCRYEETRYNGKHHHTKEGYIRLAKGKPTYLYLIKCKDEYEDFYKIGKTFRSLKERFTNSNMPYDYKKIFLYEGTPEYIWDLEEKLHIKYKPYTYKANKMFAGYSECYNLNLPIEEIIKLKSNSDV